MSTSDGVDLALRGLTAAMKRDSASGDGDLVHIITPKEYRELSEDEINKPLQGTQDTAASLFFRKDRTGPGGPWNPFPVNPFRQG